jgi:Ca-activated chloride channel homolog
MNKYLLIVIILILTNNPQVFAQQANEYLAQGNAAYQSKKYEDAIAQYQKITDNNTFQKTDRATANYNLGNAYCKLQKWQEAVDSYTKSLAQNPNAIHAKYNLCYAKQKLQQQKKEKNKNQDDQKEKDQKGKEEKQKQEQQKKQESSKQQQESQQQDEQKAKPQPSKLTKQQAEQYLKALKEEEKKLLQSKMNGKQGGAKKQKDW